MESLYYSNSNISF
ncbi:hypothetical protein E2C01_005348 [Portunus trituberculatus]|uniref:Uncharacterized protein n=1 Tax=Portunus trituberculatus TaxID=210409 RepID=A0A5B7CVA8_PORTR|nr:hypothetical protein [Portunus trituberculatus]